MHRDHILLKSKDLEPYSVFHENAIPIMNSKSIWLKFRNLNDLNKSIMNKWDHFSMKEFRPDSLDFKVIKILEGDCSKTYREISEETGRDLWMIRDRVVMLKKKGIVGKCKAEINYPGVGLNCRALIMFNVPEENIDRFVSFAKSTQEFKRLIIATGQRRFYLEVVGENCNGIREYARKTLPGFGIYDVAFEVILDSPVQ